MSIIFICPPGGQAGGDMGVHLCEFRHAQHEGRSLGQRSPGSSLLPPLEGSKAVRLGNQSVYPFGYLPGPLVYVSVGVGTCAAACTWLHTCGCQRTILRSELSPSTSMWLPGITQKLVWQKYLSPAPSCQPDMNLSVGQRLYTPGSSPYFSHLCK